MNSSYSRPHPRFLILGGGAVTKELHAPALAMLGWCPGAAVLEISGRNALDLRAAFPNLEVRNESYRDVLKDPRVRDSFDGVVVNLPNKLHEESVRLSIEAGLPVLCEKPLANDRQACMRLAEVSADRDCPLSVAMVRRLIPWVCAVRNSLRTNLLGELESITIEHGAKFRWPTESTVYFTPEDGGILLNMGIHYLDMLESWIGPMIPFDYSDDYAGGVESNARIKLKAAGNVTVELALSHTHQLSNEVVIKGSRGEIRAEVNQFSKCRWYSYDAGTVADLEPQVPFRGGSFPTNDFISAFAEQFYAFSRVIAREEEPLVTAATAAESQSAVEWAYRNRRKIFHVTQRRRRPELDPGQAVVTGGTGFLGGALVERLAELQFNQIRIPARSMRTTANVARFPIERVFTDLTDFASTKAALKGARYVFHLAYGASGPDAGKVTIAANRNVIEAAIENGAEAVVVASTASVFGHPETSTPIDETFPYRPSLGDYGESKAEAEKFCLERSKSSGKTRIVVINPSAIYGPTGLLFTQLPPQSVREGSFCWIENGRGRINYTFVGNVVDALILAARNTKAHGQRFIINDGVTTFRKFLTPILGDHAEGLRSFTKQELQALEKQNQAGPKDLLRALTSDQMMNVVNRMPALAAPKRLIEHRLAGFYQKMQSGRSGLQAAARTVEATAAAALPNPPVWLADIYGPIDVEYSSAKAKEGLGWTPLVSLEEGTEMSIEWLKYVGLFDSVAAPVPVLS